MTTIQNYPIVMSFETAVALGQIAGVAKGQPAGYVATSATTSVPVRATTYAPQGANAQRSFSSSSALDTAAGTGARTMTPTYLAASLASLNTETITLNGVTAVNSVNTDYAFLENMAVATTGSTGGNQGTLSIFISTGGAGGAWGSIAAQDNHTYWAHHYVRASTTCCVTNVTGHSTVSPGHLTFQVTGDPGNPNLPQQSIGSSYGFGAEIIVPGVLSGTPALGVAQLDHGFRLFLQRVGPDFIFLNARPANATASTVFAGFEYFEY